PFARSSVVRRGARGAVPSPEVRRARRHALHPPLFGGSWERRARDHVVASFMITKLRRAGHSIDRMSTTFHFVPWLRPLAALSFLAASGCTTDPNVVGTLEETGDLTSTSAGSGSTTGGTTAATTSTGPAPGSTTSPVDSVDGSEDGSEEATSTDGPA